VATTIQKVIQPDLINVGRRVLSTRGFKYAGLLEYLERQKDWCEVGELARVFDGRNSPTNCEKMRKRLSKGFSVFLKQDRFLSMERTKYRKAIAVKLYRGEPLEKAHAIEQIESMRRHREITEQKLHTAYQLLLSFEPTTGLEPSTPVRTAGE
jgi:hypothetical protein